MSDNAGQLERAATADFSSVGDHPHKCAVCKQEWTCLESFCVRLYASICEGCMKEYGI